MNREAIIQSWSDAFKDAHGFRPRGYMDELNAMNDAELQAAWDDLCQAVCDTIDEDRRRQAASKVEWEARIAGLMADHGIDKATALRWDAEANDFDARYGWGEYCWSQDLPYAMEAELEAILPARTLLDEQCDEETYYGLRDEGRENFYTY